MTTDAPPRRWLWRLGTLVVAALLGLVLFSPAWQAVDSVTGSAAGLRLSPCLPGTAVPIMDSPHISQAAEAAVRYNSSPPTSGPHSGATITTGIYDSTVRDAQAVHAMEHGHVIIHYGPHVTGYDVATLRRFAKRYPEDVVLTPDPRLGDPIALTAWGRIDILPALDQPRIERFIEALRGRYHHGWTRPSDCPATAAGAGQALQAAPVFPVVIYRSGHNRVPELLRRRRITGRHVASLIVKTDHPDRAALIRSFADAFVR